MKYTNEGRKKKMGKALEKCSMCDEKVQWKSSGRSDIAGSVE